MSNFHDRKRLLRSKHNTKTDATRIAYHTKNMQHSNITRKRKKQYSHTPKKKKKNQIKRKKPDHEPQNGLGRSASRASSPSPKPRPQTPVPSPPPSRKPARVRGWRRRRRRASPDPRRGGARRGGDRGFRVREGGRGRRQRRSRAPLRGSIAATVESPAASFRPAAPTRRRRQSGLVRRRRCGSVQAFENEGKFIPCVIYLSLLQIWQNSNLTPWLFNVLCVLKSSFTLLMIFHSKSIGTT